MEEGASTKEFLIGVSVTAACHHVTIDGLKFYGVAGGSTANALIFAGASNFSIVQNCEIYGDFSSYPVDFTGAASTYITVRNNIIHNVDTSAGYTFEAHATTTGMAVNNACLGLLDTVTPTAAAMGFCQNFVSNALGVQGIYKPSQDS